jgi:hypothetical protein
LRCGWCRLPGSCLRLDAHNTPSAPQAIAVYAGAVVDLSRPRFSYWSVSLALPGIIQVVLIATIDRRVRSILDEGYGHGVVERYQLGQWGYFPLLKTHRRAKLSGRGPGELSPAR